MIYDVTKVGLVKAVFLAESLSQEVDSEHCEGYFKQLLRNDVFFRELKFPTVTIET